MELSVKAAESKRNSPKLNFQRLKDVTETLNPNMLAGAMEELLSRKELRNKITEEFFCVARQGCVETAKLLLKWGLVNRKARNGHRETPLLEAAQEGKEEMVELLAEEGFDINAKDKYRRNALHWTAIMGHEETAKVLIQKGINLNAKDALGRTPLSLAEEREHIKIVWAIKEALGELPKKD